MLYQVGIMGVYHVFTVWLCFVLLGICGSRGILTAAARWNGGGTGRAVLATRDDSQGL